MAKIPDSPSTTTEVPTITHSLVIRWKIFPDYCIKLPAGYTQSFVECEGLKVRLKKPSRKSLQSDRSDKLNHTIIEWVRLEETLKII